MNVVRASFTVMPLLLIGNGVLTCLFCVKSLFFCHMKRFFRFRLNVSANLSTSASLFSGYTAKLAAVSYFRPDALRSNTIYRVEP